MEDSELVPAIRSGNQELFSMLIDRYGYMVYQLCYRMAADSFIAEELTHDAFVEAYLKLDQLRDPAKFRFWLKQLALNLCRMWFRAQKLQLIEHSEESRAVVEEEESNDGIHVQMALGLSRLSAHHRLVLVLHYFEQLSYDEIAGFLDIPVGTVMSRLHRARIALKQIIDGLTENPEDEEITMSSDEQLKQSIQAEISVLLDIFREQPKAVERLRIILKQSPERLAQFIQQTDDETLLGQMAILLPGLGRRAVDMVLENYFSPDAQASSNARVLLMNTLAGCEPLRAKMRDTMASIDTYILLDAVIRSAADRQAKADLLMDLLVSCKDRCTAALLISVLLCYPDEAFDLLIDQFRVTATTETLYQAPYLLHALCRMGTRFCSALIEPLGSTDLREVSLALAGAEGIARALNYTFHKEYVSPIHLANDIRTGTVLMKLSPLRKNDLDAVIYDQLAQRIALLLENQDTEIRNKALHILGHLRAEDYLELIKSRLSHPESSTRLAAIMALSEIGRIEPAEWFIATAREGSAAERCAAIEALGRLKIQESLPVLKDMVDDPDKQIQKVAVTALGEMGGEDVQLFLQELLHSKKTQLRKTVAKALYSGTVYPAQLESTKKRLQMIRGDARPFTLISMDAVIRYALPEIRQYNERELTRRIANICYDYSATRRNLMEEGLMSRSNGTCRFTEHGKTVWCVEHFIMEYYLKTIAEDESVSK